jgi:MarR-like DNA-binding transcriptional regulator SgrR of sgrS sRNA
MELSQIAKEIYESGKRLENGSKQLFTLSKEMAESEREYRRALQIEILQLRDQKVQATLIPDIARGKTSELKFKRDLAEARWTSAKQSLEAIKTQMSGLQTIIKFQEEI